MLRLLLQAGLGAATFNVGRKIAAFKRSMTYFVVAGVIALAGLGALTSALILYLEPRFGAAGAAGIVGGGLVVLAALVGWAGTWKPKPKRPTPIFERVRAEVGAAGAAVAASRRRAAARAAAVDETLAEDVPPPLPATPGQRRKKALNMVLIATLAGVVLGRRL
ncbi:hypothetical protein IHQ68_07980 [Chelatococcus sambhunathii]|uniref:Holin-X, holin superfamily III n=1 Tax=Chelatococcus sambhunathii TaxID=363953 RepID=A0ABU1DEL0_9HYPH|nr:hypothetical protein [Chelatococcus sambhunathii]MDR4306554.1 hypothetical protein [Chelatococcus sambhunathii]